jgi:hypothetical protein
MTQHEIAVVRRSLYIEMLVAAVLKSHPKWRIDRRTLAPLGLDHVYQVILRSGENHHLISFDLSSDSLEGIRRRFHFAEASFAYFIDPTHAVVLTTLPTPNMVEVPESREITPIEVPEKEMPEWLFWFFGVVLVSLILSSLFFAP